MSMATSLQLRAQSGHGCSTSSRCSPADCRPVCCLVVRADSESKQSPLSLREGWLGNGCFLSKRPTFPKSTALSEVASLNAAAISRQNGKPFKIYENTEFVAETLLPTVQGKYRVRAYRHTVDGCRTYTEPSCIISGRPEGCEQVPLRVHDACFTSEVLGSLKCDCAGQLQLAMDYIQDNAPGIIIYLQQEGRGIGLANKIAAYALQEKGLDTVDANRALGLPDDCREYTSVRNILQDLGVKSVKLMTNNPRKIRVLEQLGVVVTERLPCIVQPQALNLNYLTTKRLRMAHLLTSQEEGEQLKGQFCYWNHDGEPASPVAAQLQATTAPGQAEASRREAGATAAEAATRAADIDLQEGKPGSADLRFQQHREPQ